MKFKKIILYLVEVIVLVVTIAGFYILTEMKTQPTAVYQFTKNLQANSTITSDSLQQVYISADAVNSNFVTNPEYFANKIVNTDVYAGQYVIGQQLSDVSTKDPFVDMDLSGFVKVVITLDVSRAGVGTIKAGDEVDLVYMGTGNSVDGGFTYASRFMEEVLIYKVLDSSLNTYYNYVEDPVRYDSEGNVIPVSSNLSYVIACVTPEQALEIMTRQTTGTIHAMVRFDETETKPIQDFIVGTPGEVTLGFGQVEQ